MDDQVTVKEVKESLQREMNILIETEIDGNYIFKTVDDEREYERLGRLYNELAYVMNEYM